MANQDLEKYIQSARAQGATDDAIKSQLIKSGWGESDIDEALKPHAGPALPVPPAPRFGMWVSFEYIIFFISLYISSVSLGGILFSWVDALFPDTLNPYNYSFISMPGYAAALIVAFPIFAFFFIHLRAQLLKKPGVKNLKSRKFLFYLTLIVAFVTMVSDLISNLSSFLQGEVTARSLGHLGAIFLVAGSVFVYLLLQVKEDRKA